jgi:hypothetical protein
MKQRSPFHTSEYWSEWTQRRKERIIQYEKTVSTPTIEPTHRRRLRFVIYREHFHLLITRYSRGEPIEVLQETFPQVVNALAAYQSEDGSDPYDLEVRNQYVDALWLLSLALLLNASQDVTEQLLQLVSNEGEDALLEQLARFRVKGRQLASDLLHQRSYESLYDALNAQNKDRDALIKNFLKQYYPSMRKCYWYDSHKEPTSGFFGYWCFELAAFVKELHIPDDSFVDNPYYPDDLIKW